MPADPAKATDKSQPGECDAFLRMIEDEAPLPRREHDQPVDAVVTADGLVDMGVSRRRPPA